MNIPNKNYDLKDAAHLFGISEIEFYKILRGESKKYPIKRQWINASRQERNHPYHWTIAAGFLTTEQRKRPSQRNKKVKVHYVVTVITRLGIHELENKLNIASSLPPLVLPLNEQNARELQQKPRSAEDQTERKKCLELLGSMGLLNKAS
ncbi:phage antirepressor KilAC domain-containing protein [Cellvibrio mixtus]|uniref:phage antirepressor KilAC domain-containing protein n=1 Tax=Cellvibrio mixtus TaxID=39650 RepID=UPI000587EB44|nr:phage antirepressor KilAC domain-containing protein [Cellvibrio mixtus]